ncbi:MAG: LysR family transcriptional regulator [Myxococcales bacterium]
MSESTAPDLNRVGIFLKVVEAGGFTAAAKELGLPKSSVSRAVALLEQELRARLLRRTTRKVAPTEAGAAFYERASRGMALLGEAREAVVELDAELRGPIRVTTAVDLAVWRLAPVVSAFVEQHPAVMIDVVLTGRRVDLLEEGFDFALRAGNLQDESLVARRLPPAEFALYAASSYLERHGVPKRVAELSRHRCVVFRSPGGRTRWELHGEKGAPEFVDVVGALNVDDFSFATQAVVAGAGIGLLPAFVAEAAGGERIRRVLPRYFWPGGHVHLVYPAERYMPRRCVAFRDFVVEHAMRWSTLRSRAK